MIKHIRNTKRKRKLLLAASLFLIAYALSACGGKDRETEEQAPAYIYVPKQLAVSPSGGYIMPEGFQNPAVEGGQVFYMRQTVESQTVERAVFLEDDSAVDFRDAEVLFSISAYAFEKEEGNGSEAEVLTMLDTAMDRESRPVRPGSDGIVNVDPEKIYFHFILHDYAVDQEQNVYFMLGCSWGSYFSMENMGSVLCRRTAEGEWAYRHFFSGLETSGDSLAADGSGGVYILTESGILLVDGDGREAGMTGTDEYKGKSYSSERLLGDSRGNVYYFVLEEYGSSWKAMAVGQQGRKGLEEVEGLSGRDQMGFGICAVFQGDVFYSVSDILYTYDRDKGSSRETLEWTSSGLISSNIRDCFPLGKDRFLVWYDEPAMEGLYLLVKTPIEEELPERETVVLATFDVPLELRNAVIRFNRLSKEYQVVLESYGYSNETASGAETRLGAALASSDPPDLLSLSGRNLEKDMEKGLLEDLSPCLDGSSMLDREDFLENVLEGYTVEGSLVGIPIRIYPVAAGVRTSQADGLDSWTMEDVYALAERYPQQTVLLSDSTYDIYTGKRRVLGTSEYLLGKFCAAWYLEEYVDWKNGECDFDSEGFRRLLVWVGEHAEEKTPPAGAQGSISIMQSFPKEALLIAQYVDFEDAAMWEALVGEEITLTGFPTADGRGTAKVNVEAPFGIVAGSGNREGAWEFLEYYISSSIEGRWIHGLPTSRSRLRELMEKEIQRSTPSFVYIDDEEVRLDEMSREMAAKLMELLESADFTPESGLRNMVVRIVLEETEPYYAGDKSLDEAVGIIQNRVQLLLKENQ